MIRIHETYLTITTNCFWVTVYWAFTVLTCFTFPCRSRPLCDDQEILVIAKLNLDYLFLATLIVLFDLQKRKTSQKWNLHTKVDKKCFYTVRHSGNRKICVPLYNNLCAEQRVSSHSYWSFWWMYCVQNVTVCYCTLLYCTHCGCIDCVLHRR